MDESIEREKIVWDDKEAMGFPYRALPYQRGGKVFYMDPENIGAVVVYPGYSPTIDVKEKNVTWGENLFHGEDALELLENLVRYMRFLRDMDAGR